jgi:hypothetical protein
MLSCTLLIAQESNCVHQRSTGCRCGGLRIQQ